MKQQSQDPWVQRTIVGALAITLCTCAGGSIGLVLANQPIPGLIIGLGTSSIGILAQMARKYSS